LNNSLTALAATGDRTNRTGRPLSFSASIIRPSQQPMSLASRQRERFNASKNPLPQSYSST